MICNWHNCKKEFTPNKENQRFCKRNCRVSEAVAQKRRRAKEKAVAFLGGKCYHCSYSKCLRALSFHHLDNKDDTIAKMIGNNKSWSVIELELKKCELLCSNCHMEEHCNNC